MGFVLNMAIEIDDFFPDLYRYCHVQIWDEPDVDILAFLGVPSGARKHKCM